MINKTEKEVMRSWKDNKQTMVSIACIAYNQDYCISETLNGFLVQETSFPFEILINDDASTDRTAKIIREYEKKFPHIVKPVYQSENKWSQGINVIVPLFPKAKGRYVAICDGDDYWIDKNKLEIQVREMEKHPNIDMSFHPSYQLLDDRRADVLSKYSDQNRIFTPQEIILGGGEFCPTASLMLTNKLILSLPSWTNKIKLLDYVLQIMGSAKGGALYIDKCMAIYRVGHEGSWKNSVYKSADNSEVRKKALLSTIEILNLLNDFYDNKFQKEFNKLIHDYSLKFVKTIVLDVSLREEVFNLHKDIFSKKQRILWCFLYRNKSLHNVFKRIRQMTYKRRRK